MHYRSAAASSTRIVASPYLSNRTAGFGNRRRKRRPNFDHHLSFAIGITIFLTIVTCLAFLKFFVYITFPSESTLEAGGVWGAVDEILPWNPIYRVPGSIESVGDRSDEYVKLRKKYDSLLIQNHTRSLQAAADLQARSYASELTIAAMDTHDTDQVPYDIYDCPETPPVGYPFAWNVMTVLNNWQPDNTSPPASNQIYQGLCVFDYQTDYDKAVLYRNAELPFVVINDPNVAATAERWNQPGYMEELLGDEPHRTEYSKNNHFMYYIPVSKKYKQNKKHRLKVPKDWKAPTKPLRMPYKRWLQKANVTTDVSGPNNPHWYYRLIGCGATGRDGSCDKGSSEYLFDELPFFQPKKSLYIVEPTEQKGCVAVRVFDDQGVKSIVESCSPCCFSRSFTESIVVLVWRGSLLKTTLMLAAMPLHYLVVAVDTF